MKNLKPFILAFVIIYVVVATVYIGCIHIKKVTGDQNSLPTISDNCDTKEQENLEAVADKGIPVEAICLKDYSVAEGGWPVITYSGVNLGPAEDPKAAIDCAKVIWAREYGNSAIWGGGESEIWVSYDWEYDCWLVRTVNPINVVGVNPYAVIRRNGDVLAVWMA